MSFDYLITPYNEISESKASRIGIYDCFQDFECLDKYLYISIIQWNRDYPLPLLPNNVIVLEFKCEYKFPLNNLPSSIEVLCFHDEYEYSLNNLPINLYQLEISGLYYNNDPYIKHTINIPESVKILNLNNAICQSSHNLPIKLKQLEFSSNTFTDEIVIYPPELEVLYLRHNSEINSQEDLEKLEKYFNLHNLPLTIRSLILPNVNISNLEIILKRLIHLKSLVIPNNFKCEILEFPPNLVEFYITAKYEYKLFNLPSSLKYISIDWEYNSDSLEAIANSNIEHIDLNYNNKISIINYLPKSLKKITIIESHHEYNRIKKYYPYLEIDTIPDYDYQEAKLKEIRYEWMFSE